LVASTLQQRDLTAKVNENIKKNKIKREENTPKLI
jgi:hypothetical protein